MNNERRKRLTALSQQLAELKDDIQSVLDEEEEAFSNLPESLQNGERGHCCTGCSSQRTGRNQ
ncbi:hypothetical protein [Salmonella enterica]|uniref:hypothetical protein n=1 Tax=Salmonella enterica TaxID=28901 RepID=UPI0019882C6C|nr:hypothetical protein [Salmonella enterica]EHX6162035.1 hypothetical protein [Salmonella enterica subsp. enterica serovar Canada]HCB4954804.1 hypothetical protein [Salmonella enterica subsp. enterica serovar Bredeney]HCB5294911.1 hypothetical protein [Salmonella enterica subsp. enterica serovar Bredeney]